MDTKLKKSSFYSKGIKITAVILCFLFTVASVACSIGIIWTTDKFEYAFGGNYAFEYGKYTDTMDFTNRFKDSIDKAVYVNLVYKSEGNVREGKTVNEEELLKEFKDYYNITDGVITSSTVINDDYTVGIISPEGIPDDLIYNYQEYSDLVSNKLRGYRNVYIQSQLDTYISMKKDLDGYKNFFYYIENDKGNRVAGNSNKQDITEFNQYIILNGDFLSDKMDSYSGYSNPIISDGNYILYAGITDQFVPGDSFYESNSSFLVKKSAFPCFVSGLLASLFIIVILAAYLMRVAGQDEKNGTISLKSVDSIFNDIHCWLVALAGVLSVSVAIVLGTSIIASYDILTQLVLGGMLSLLALVDMAIILSFLCSMSRQGKAHRIFYNTLVAAIFRKIGEILGGKSLTGWIVVLFGAYTAGCLFLFSMANYEGIFVFVLMGFVTIVVIMLIKNMESLTTIMRSVKSASTGEYKDIDVKKISPMFASFSTDINNLQIGLKSSIQEAVKGERMKADLITNVSHDLKTPLTSIITYVDLLKREELDNTVASGYVDVLVDKSQRLKQLIEDLIEASKASSGNLPVDKSKIDLKELLLQACGEFEEKAQGLRLEFRIATKGTVFVDADGKHMWRVYENLFSNVIKYAMPNSRVYVDIYKNDKYGIMTMKNVSHDEIKVNVENLAERFTRGDSARTTDGSGLGLSIAKSLTIIQGGNFNLSVEGDMFKVYIEMPLWHEPVEAPKEVIEAEGPSIVKEVKTKFKISKIRNQKNSDTTENMQQGNKEAEIEKSKEVGQ